MTHRAGNTKRKRIFNEEYGLCWICNLPMSLPCGSFTISSKWDVTIDHIVPKSKLYINKQRPYRGAHRFCNEVRAHRPLDCRTMKKHIRNMQSIKEHIYQMAYTK